VLDGRPTLYLTESGLFAGPPAPALDTELRKNIPAPALETTNGLRYLHAAGIPLPKHLSKRIRTVPVGITISCALKPIYPGSQTEDIVLCVAAKASGMKSERFTPKGWDVEQKNGAGENSAPANGVIVVHDRAAQQFSAGDRIAGIKMGYLPRRLEVATHEQNAGTVRRVAQIAPARN
jgi:hypothetical protein